MVCGLDSSGSEKGGAFVNMVMSTQEQLCAVIYPT
jgi:hypothetical protein